MRATVAFVLPILLLAGCLEPKTGCLITDDCAPGRVCVAGTCQPKGAGQDAGFGQDLARDLSEELKPDLAAGPDGAPDRIASDVPAPIDAPESPVRPDANVADETTDLSEKNSLDLASDPGAVPDLPLPPVDGAPDAGLDAPTIDAPNTPGVQDAISDGESQPESGAPDMPLFLADAAPDAPPDVVIDAPPQGGAPAGNPDADAESDASGDSAPGRVSWEDFRAQCPREPWVGGRYIVDGDLPMDEVGLEDYYYKARFAPGVGVIEFLAPMGATATWSSTDAMSLSYCISTDFGGKLATVEAAIQAAAASWSDRVGVGYTYLPAEDGNCDPNNANVTFDVRPVSGAGYAAVSFFPDSVRSNRSVLIDSSAFESGAELEAILRHQLGHTLGFRHEFLWLDPACTSEDPAQAVRIANYDVDSVMHLPACRPSELGGKIQTEGDFFGAMTIYGPSPALIIVITM